MHLSRKKKNMHRDVLRLLVVTSANDKTLLSHLSHSICAQECNLGKGLPMTFCKKRSKNSPALPITVELTGQLQNEG